MNHQELANQFNQFAYELIKKHNLINQEIISIQNEILLRRIIFSRFYYALYHKYLAHDSKLSKSTGASKHDAIKQTIQHCNDDKLNQIFIKLQNLRVWADYNLDENNNQALNINLNQLSNDVHSILKREKHNCAKN